MTDALEALEIKVLAFLQEDARLPCNHCGRIIYYWHCMETPCILKNNELTNEYIRAYGKLRYDRLVQEYISRYGPETYASTIKYCVAVHKKKGQAAYEREVAQLINTLGTEVYEFHRSSEAQERLLQYIWVPGRCMGCQKQTGRISIEINPNKPGPLPESVATWCQWCRQ